jgi:hypothetical protein
MANSAPSVAADRARRVTGLNRLIGAVIAHTPSLAGFQVPVFRSPATRSRQLLGFSNDAIA